MVGSEVKNVYFFSPSAIGGSLNADVALYAAIYVLSDKLLNDDAEKIFYAAWRQSLLQDARKCIW